MKSIRERSVVSGLLWLCLVGTATAEPAAFETADEAVSAVVAAVEAEDGPALLGVFGAESKDLIFTGDEVTDRANWREFLASYRQEHRIEMTADGVAVLYIGRKDWPFPLQIVATNAGWRFDVEGAREEIVDRRIGLNELDVMDLLRDGVDVQRTYRLEDHDGDGVLEFASSILSSPGARDGLYWQEEEGTEESPIGDFLARASADGFSFDGTDEPPDPYLGYYFRILQRQGTHAPGGAYDYLIGGNMVAGHAYLAYPAEYGESGVMSFLVGEAGVIYEADLGAKTLDVAAAIDSFDPGPGWAKVE